MKRTYAPYLASNYIRRMRLAIYSAENIGHYGLSLTHYCHFTSPIRRYVDLIVHRILFGESDDLEYLQRVANQCSDQERISAKAESSVVTLKKLRLLQSMHTQDPYKEYPAIITRVKNFGIYFEIIDLLLEGFLHISELGDDYFVYEEEHMHLRGTRRGGRYAPGNRVTVMLRRVDFISQETEWYLVANESPKALHSTKKSSKKRSRKADGKHLLSQRGSKRAGKQGPEKKAERKTDKKKRAGKSE